MIAHPVVLVHIGKCGGSTVNALLRNTPLEYRRLHTTKDHKELKISSDERLIIWIRDPLTRFVSAFNMSKAVLTEDIEGREAETVNLANSIAPPAIKRRIRTGHAFSIEYEALIAEFGTASELAEALSDPDPDRRKLAQQLMIHPEQNIGRGIGWHLDNGEFVKKYSDQIFYVGRLENMAPDLRELFQKLRLTRPKVEHVRKNRDTSLPKELSPLAQANLRSHLEDTDYRALDTLHEFGWISDRVVADYRGQTLG